MGSGDFYSIIFRMRFINRWGLMRNTQSENLMEHSMEVALIAHGLAVIGNVKFGADHDCDRIATAALFHDMNEILTGDLPTPVKYYNDAIRTAYKDIEKQSTDKLLSLLEDDLRAEYEKALDVTPEEKKLIKAADRLCAYIKCLDEISRCNRDFESAQRSIKADLDSFDCPELNWFLANCLDSFSKTLDQVTL